jgi:hypothetical protein
MCGPYPSACTHAALTQRHDLCRGCIHSLRASLERRRAQSNPLPYQTHAVSAGRAALARSPAARQGMARPGLMKVIPIPLGKRGTGMNGRPARAARLSGCRSVSSSCVSSSRRAAFRYSFSSSGTMDGTFSRYLRRGQGQGQDRGQGGHRVTAAAIVLGEASHRCRRRRGAWRRMRWCPQAACGARAAARLRHAWAHLPSSWALFRISGTEVGLPDPISSRLAAAG